METLRAEGIVAALAGEQTWIDVAGSCLIGLFEGKDDMARLEDYLREDPRRVRVYALQKDGETALIPLGRRAVVLQFL